MIYSIFLKKLRTTTEYKRPTKFPMCSFKTNKKIPISFCVSKKTLKKIGLAQENSNLFLVSILLTSAIHKDPHIFTIMFMRESNAVI